MCVRGNIAGTLHVVAMASSLVVAMASSSISLVVAMATRHCGSPCGFKLRLVAAHYVYVHF
jgi:hypothetical protein